MTTWRERIVAARERGYFTADDHAAARDLNTCAAGEAVRAVGLDSHTAHAKGWRELWRKDYGSRFCNAVWLDDPDRAERELDRIEDRVMTLKREAAS